MAKRLIVAILTVACWLAVAHPMGNFSVSHYARFDLKPGAVDLVYVLDLAELPTFDLLRGWGLERTSPKAQLERKAAEQAREWAKHLDIASDGRAVEPKFVRAEIALSDGAGNLPVMRVTSHLRLPVLAGKLTYEDRNFPDRAGWKEIVIGAGEGSTVLTASQGAVDRSKALVEYPQDPTVAPPQDVRASMEWKGAPTAPVAVVAAVEKPAPVIVPVPQPKAPAAVAPATMTTQAAPPGAMVKGDFLSRLLHQRELSFGMILIAIAAAFGLGAAHALTPGHGKTIVAAYLVGSRGTLKHAAFLGAMVTFTHTVSVFLLGLATLFLFQYVVPEKITQWLGVISGLSIVGIGGWMLFTRLRGAQVDAHVMGHDGDHGHPHDHSHADAHDLMHAHAYAIGVAGADAQVHSHASVDEPKLAHLHIAARADAHSSDHSHPHAHEPVHSHSQLAGVASPDAHGHSHGHSHPHPHEPVHVHSQPSGVMSLEIHDHSHEHSHPHSHEPVHVHSQPGGMASLESHDNSHGHSHPHEPVHVHSQPDGMASLESHDDSHGHSHPHAHEPVHVHSQLAGTATHDAHDLSHAHPHPHAHSHPNAVGVASHAHGHGHGHDHAHPHPHTHGSLAHSHGPGGQVHSHDVPDTITWGSLTALAISGGLVPCESALLLLLSAIALGRVGLGLLLLIAFSLGLAVVLMGIGVLVIYAKDLFPERDKSKPRHPVFRWIPVASAAVVMVIGILMTGVSLGWIQAKWMV